MVVVLPGSSVVDVVLVVVSAVCHGQHVGAGGAGGAGVVLLGVGELVVVVTSVPQLFSSRDQLAESADQRHLAFPVH
ncbi:hypothetical protein [Bremerella volcania]|uniref:hypothetical protein n=1 Tax=Bremerella volcania TaxID=2527984 RepID=UPI00119EBE73|nr:hypothetical protein [Bremerella volcania]